MLLTTVRPSGLTLPRFFRQHPSNYLAIATVAAMVLFLTGVGYKTMEESRKMRLVNASAGLSPEEGHWIATWTTVQDGCPLEEEIAPFGRLIPSSFAVDGIAMADTTVRQTVRVSLGAQEIRIRLSNAFGESTLRIDKANIARTSPELVYGKNTLAGSPTIETSTIQTLTFSGQEHAYIPPNGQMISDPVRFPVGNAEIITISLYLRDGQWSNYVTCHMDAKSSTWLTRGDQTAQANISPESSDVLEHWYFLSTIEAWTPLDHHTIVALGDSIIDGAGADPNANNKWTDILFDHLQSAGLTRFAVVNQAVGGNSATVNGRPGGTLNLNARLDHDALTLQGVKYAILHEGIIDVGSGQYAETTLIQLRQVIARLHGANIPVFGGTLSPFSCNPELAANPWWAANEPGHEEQRLLLNSWIRNGDVYDAVIDFDAMLQNPENITEQASEFLGPDCLHPNAAGMRAMIDGFPIDVFEKFEDGVQGYL